MATVPPLLATPLISTCRGAPCQQVSTGSCTAQRGCVTLLGKGGNWGAMGWGTPSPSDRLALAPPRKGSTGAKVMLCLQGVHGVGW